MEEARCSSHWGGCIGPSVICSCFVLKSSPCLDIQWLQSGKIPFHLRWCINPRHFNRTWSIRLWHYVYACAMKQTFEYAPKVCFDCLQACGAIWILCKLTATPVRVLPSITLIMRHGSGDWLGENSPSKKERKERSYPCGSGTVCAVKSSGVGDKCQGWLWCRCFVYFIMLVVKNI